MLGDPKPRLGLFIWRIYGHKANDSDAKQGNTFATFDFMNLPVRALGPLLRS